LLKLTPLFRQQIGGSPFYYESESSAGYFRRRVPTPGTNDYEAFRGDTYHQITLPQHFFGWLNVAPRVGGRFTITARLMAMPQRLTMKIEPC